MKQRTERQITPDLPQLRILARSGAGIALSHGAAAQPSPAQLPADAAVQLPPFAAEGLDGHSGYQGANWALPNLTQPAAGHPQSITVILHRLMKDQQTTAVRDTIRNVPGISLAAGEAARKSTA